MNRRTKTLGLYLLMASVLQICLYLALSISTDKIDGLFYFDPRLGIFFLESSLRGAERVTPGFFQWLSAGWILLVGLMLLFGRPLVRTYVVSEIILSLPSVVFFLMVLWVNMSPAHGFSAGELLFPLMVMIAFSVVPLLLAFRTRKKATGVDLSISARA